MLKPIVAGLIGAVLAMPALAAEPVPTTEEEKTVYAIGLAIGQSLATYSLTREELEFVKAGLSDAALGHSPKVNAQQYRARIQALTKERRRSAAEREKNASRQFLSEMARVDGAVTTDSGLIYIAMTQGTGPNPKASDSVGVHYHGTLRDGTVFDSSRERGKPVTFPLSRVIPCWTEGLQLMKVGGRSKLACPSDIAYGDRGSPPRIKPGATLVFEVELIVIQ